jgi:hypothetical protein
MAVTQQPNRSSGSRERPALSGGAYARPEDPYTNTRPPGNGVRNEHDTERGAQKLRQVLGC